MQTMLIHKETEPFWDRIAPKYAKKSISDPGAYEEKLSTVGSLLNPEDHVLEIGCGTGGTALRLAPSVAQLTATDVSKGMIKIAQSKLDSETHANVRFVQAEAADLVQGQPFDVICAFSLLHLVEDIQQVLSGVYQQLKPGGLFVSKTVCLRDGSLSIRLLVRALTAVGIAPAVTALSKAELISHLKFAGLEIETATFFGNQRTNPFIVARRPNL